MQNVRALILGATLALTPALIHAQLPVSTGAQQAGGRDTRWQLAYGLTGGTLSAFSDAFVITSPVWAVPSSASWIGATSSSSVPGGTGDGQRRFTYVARTQFTLNAGDQLTYTFQCTFDNYWLGLFVNGTQVGTTACGSDNTFSLASAFTVSPSSFMAGLNTIDFRWQGDGITDAIVIRSTATTLVPGTPGVPGVVPEPSTYALMATGMAALVGISRRRRKLS